jgi:polar amino acid transport system substrate-binding protein
LWRRIPVRRLLAAGVLLLASATAAAAAPAVPPAAPVKVLVEDAASPWSDHNGVGLANDLVREAFAAAGARASLAVVPYARCKALVMEGAAPSCLSMSAAPELAGKVRFADKPLFTVTAHVYAARANPAPPRSLGDLRAGMRVGLVHGYEYQAEILALAKRGVVFETARSEVVNLRKLAAGRLDAAVVMADTLRSVDLVERQASTDAVVHAFTGPAMGSYIGFSTTHPDGERQRLLFNAGFKSLIDSGERARIEARWQARCARFCAE